MRAEKERLAREQAAREAILHILSEHKETTVTANKASFSASKTIKKTGTTVQENKDLIKHYEEELLEHVQRLAELEEMELGRQAMEISKIEEKANNHGKELNFFKPPSISQSLTRELSLEEEEEKKKIEWERALARGSKFVIKDPAAHFAKKNAIRSRMVELAQILS